MSFDADGLWPHQGEAVGLAAKQLADGGRATVVAATGTGKTLVGAHTALRVAPRGRVLIAAPTIMLVTQTLRVYREAGGLGRVLLVCSRGDTETGGRAAQEALRELQDLRAEVSTDPERITAAVAGEGRVTVLTTYASVEAIAAAHHDHGAPAWDLIVADEAHRTAGQGPWSRIHDDAVVPARRRFYMTATPRVMTRGDAEDAPRGMNDEALFGPTVYRLGLTEAIELGRLARYRLVISILTSEQIRAAIGSSDGEEEFIQLGNMAVPPRMLAAQIALLRTAREFGVRAAISFHTRVAAARTFSATLPAAAGLLPPEQRPATLWAGDVHAEHSLLQQRLRLRHLSEPDPDGLAVISNARLLGEGVDIPAVDAVLFADPRQSPIDVVQGIGRALRLGGRPDKTATIIVPLLADEASLQDPEVALAASQYAPVWTVIRALRSHDEELAVELDIQARALGGRGTRPGRDPAEVWRPHWLEITGARLPAGFAEAIKVHMVEAATTRWDHVYGALAAFHAEHDHLRVPLDHRAPNGVRTASWLVVQRRSRQHGVLAAERIALLDAIAMPWDPQQDAWDRGYEYARAHHTAHGHLDLPDSYTTTDKFPLGKWLATQRESRRAATLTPERAAKLDALGIIWEPKQHLWQRTLAYAAAYHHEHGHLRVHPDHVTSDGYSFGHRILYLRHLYKQGSLTAEQIAALESHGMVWDARQAEWDTWYEHAATYAAKTGHLRMKNNYRTADGHQLGQWLWRQANRARLTPQRRTRLDALDPDWQRARTR